MTETIVLRVGATGRIVATSQGGEAWLDRAGSAACHRVVGAKKPDGRALCRPDCAMALAAGSESALEEEGGRRAIVRGKVACLDCRRVGDEVIVTVRRSDVGEPLPDEILTEREREVLGYVARGLSSDRIADELGLRPSTVRTHVEHARRRLGVHTRAQAVARALATGQLETVDTEDEPEDTVVETGAA